MKSESTILQTSFDGSKSSFSNTLMESISTTDSESARSLQSPRDTSDCQSAEDRSRQEIVRMHQRMLDNPVADHERTTLMIRNIPNRYTLEMLLDEIQSVGDCKFLHLPQAKKTDSNLGY